MEKFWSITDDGTFIDGSQISDVKLKNLNLMDHHSIRVKIGIKKNAKNIGGINIFGNGFGDYDYGIQHFPSLHDLGPYPGCGIYFPVLHRNYPGFRRNRVYNQLLTSRNWNGFHFPCNSCISNYDGGER